MCKNSREQRECRRDVRPNSQPHRDPDDRYGDEVHSALKDEERHCAASDVLHGHATLAQRPGTQGQSSVPLAGTSEPTANSDMPSR
jgi:hypothetical protein